MLARTVARSGASVDLAARAARTTAALDAMATSWAKPWWLDRQLRPSHAAFVPVGELGLVENVTGRSWTVLSTASSGPMATVDPAGAVHPTGASWSLDWAIGAEDRWHCAASEPTVRQRLVSFAPVVETVCKVPSGEAIARAYAVAAGGTGGHAVVFEIENESPVPFVALFAIRPTHPLGVGSVSSIRYEHPHVLIDERAVVMLDKAAARWSACDAPHDALVEAINGDAREGGFEPVRSASGLATATFLVPVPHRTSVRVLLYPDAPRRERPERLAVVATAGQVARGWEAHTAHAARVELPDRRISEGYTAAVRSISAACAGTFPIPFGRESDWRVADEATVVRALARIGLGDLAAPLLRGRCDELELDSWFRREPASIERNLAIFDAVGAHWNATHDRALIDDVVAAVVKAAHWVERARSRSATQVAEPTARRASGSLAVLASALRSCGQPDAADDLQSFAARFVLDIEGDDTASDDTASDDTASDRELDDTTSDRELDDDVAVELDRSVAVGSPRGFDVAATIAATRSDLAAGDAFAFERLEWLLRVGGTTSRWPTHVHPRLLTGSAGAGDDPAVSAAFVALVRALVVDDSETDVVRLLPLVPPTWFGQNLDVHDLPTNAGSLSFALRWHGARPALLWELTSHHAGEASNVVTITAPGLDESWSTNEHQGEALLAAPRTAEPIELVAHPSTDHVPMTTFEPRVRREPAAGRPVQSAGSTEDPAAEEPAVEAPLAEPGESFG
jgi:hypothetical protein